MEFVGIGIVPDIEVNETIRSIREQKDIVLEKAIECIIKRKIVLKDQEELVCFILTTLVLN